ncbi:hypothetical protein [Methylomarinovum tepidoasis]|uniref:hypothetical protein n=1 Tax=Methylomarinovum tepidoasis TaxID=2840183 RepID=UPI002573E7EC|nr:hypothetical protein [Methylomarinovum sp. IN45]
MHFISSLIGINLLSPHAVPFAAPLVIAAFTGFTIGAIIISLMDAKPVSHQEN